MVHKTQAIQELTDILARTSPLPFYTSVTVPSLVVLKHVPGPLVLLGSQPGVAFTQLAT
jgi:hypothetical protein